VRQHGGFNQAYRISVEVNDLHFLQLFREVLLCLLPPNNGLLELFQIFERDQELGHFINWLSYSPCRSGDI
jgi:hypothetical protein